MRILKRNLAFVLALVMALSLTVSAMGVEDYSDVNEIAFVEAVDVLTEMGILEGTDGEFNPTKVLNRAEAAKIIAYMLLGKNAADNLQAVTAPFEDVAANHWAAGYIAHCVNEGIINGVSATEYNPNGELTATAFAKMLLAAVGYNANNEFTGARWETEVNALALKLGVFNGNLGAELGAGCTREEAALYAFNTLMNIDTVKYSELMGAYYAGATFFDTESGTTLNEALYDFDTKNDTDAFGRVGHVWLNAKNKVVTGLYADEADAVYTAAVKSGTIYADLGLSETTVADVIINGKDGGDFQIKKNSTTKTSTFGAGNGTLVEAYVDEDDNVTLVMIDTYLAEVDADAEDGEVEVTVFNAPANNGVFETEVEYKAEDLVLVTIADGKIQSMVAADEVTGDLQAVASSYVKLSDEKYNLASKVAKADCFDGSYTSETAVVLDEYGYAIGMYIVEEEEAIDGYVLVVDSQSRADNLLVDEAAVVKVMYLDGTGYEVLPLPTRVQNKENQVRLPSGWTKLTTAEEPVEYGFYGYYMNEDGAIVLKNLDAKKAMQTLDDVTKTEDSVVSFKKAQKGTFGAETAKILNSASELTLVGEDTIETTVGYKNINIDEKDVDALMLFDGKVINEIIVVDGEAISADTYAYYNGEQYTNNKGTWITLYVDGEAVSYIYEDADGVKPTMTYQHTPNAEKQTSAVLHKGVYVIEVEGDQLVNMNRVAMGDNINTTGDDGYAQVVLVAKNLYFQTVLDNPETTDVDESVKEYYHDDVKVYDITDGGVEATIAKNDKVIFVLDRSTNKTGLVTYAYIVGRVDKDATTNDDGANNTAVTATVTVNNGVATITVTGEYEEVTVDVLKSVGGEYGICAEDVVVADGTYELGEGLEAGNYVLKVYVDGVLEATAGPVYLF